METIRTIPFPATQHRTITRGGQLRQLISVYLLAFLAGCQSSPQLEQLLARQAVHGEWLSSGPFELLVVRPPGTASQGQTLHVYLGGDGRPWQGQTPAA